jgi:hypothetical protein
MKKSNDLNRMTPEDFEKQLERQAIRPVPAAWRADILKAAHAESLAPRAAEQPTQISGHFALRIVHVLWRELILPCRGIWAGLAAIWLVILVLNLPGGGKSAWLAVKTSPPDQQVLAVLREQREMLTQFAEPLAPSPAIPTRTPGPRSELLQTTTLV